MQCLTFLGHVLIAGGPSSRSCGAGVLPEFLKAQAKGWSPGAHQLDEVKLFHNHNNYLGTYCVPGTSYRFSFTLS